MAEVDWDALWLAFKLRHANTRGRTHREPGGLVRFIQNEHDNFIADGDSFHTSLIGKTMSEFGIEPSGANYTALVHAAKRDKESQ